ncbi:LADA_0B09560g1_1 [Lachancea dasiensis]|uniref:LADA_0B09560g1_1 n=1 Tax=Lachancea dasiensis TaxID=1072105 RepID=A0A1G4IUU8_9SACH|nr:LADA_0B09560g1_1 [Lachancea dasiensis]
MTESHTAIQLIDEAKEFNPAVLDYFRQCISGRDVGLDYHVISVFGSQSSGKSTLLNALFGTQFDTMNAKNKRQQTTKGIWLGHTREVTVANQGKDAIDDLFVLDVEGSDGAERGEDQDFERKAALFAIAVSEILIVNMWEQQVGLYQGNNMALLKTVFEVNLSLFGHRNDHKVLLLFVIRDHVGVTPLDSLRDTLETELQDIWSQLTKPEGCENRCLYDFFDLKFTALGHKVLQPDVFAENLGALGSHFSEKPNSKASYFKSEYHHNLPLDGWTMYAGNCWNQIETNRDLDLPTQQVLVAKFKTEEIAHQALVQFQESYPRQLFGANQRQMLIDTLQSLKSQCLGDYDSFASRYARSVFLETRSGLTKSIEAEFQKTIANHLTAVQEALIANFEKELTAKPKTKSFIEHLTATQSVSSEEFRAYLSELIKLEMVPSLNDEESSFFTSLEQACTLQSQKYLKQTVIRSGKNITTGLKEGVVYLLMHPEKDLWDRVMERFEFVISQSLSRFDVGDGLFDFQTGLSDENNKKVYQQIRSKAWRSLHEIVHENLSDDNIVSTLRERFENKFRFDENDSPRLWKNEEEINTAYRVAKEHAFEVLDVLSLAASSDHVEIIPDVPIKFNDGIDDELDGDGMGEYEDENGIYHQKSFAHILTASQREKVIQKFKREANIAVIEAKRSIIKTTTHIPLYIYALLAVLGWNEFLMIVRNPLFVTLLLIIGVSFYVIHKLNLWRPVMALTNSAVGETKALVKEKLTSWLDGPDLVTPSQSRPEAQSKNSFEEFELQDLNKKPSSGSAKPQ